MKPSSLVSAGYTLVEIMVVVAILGILATTAYLPMRTFVNTARDQKAVQDMKTMETEIMAYVTEHGQLPDSLADIGREGMLDPWGKPYVYLRLSGGKTKGLNGKRRRDKNNNPVNTDFDLYSMGPDGETSAQFMGSKGRDDIVRANDGRYYGTAEEHVPL